MPRKPGTAEEARECGRRMWPDNVESVKECHVAIACRCLGVLGLRFEV